MTQSPDHPELVYLEARTSSGGPMYTIGRPDGPPLWIVIHDMEAVESPSCAENTANYFHTGAGGRSVSSHYCADDNSIVQCVLLRHSAWTVGNRPGNNRGINWELCGFAAQSRAQWLDAFGQAMFARMVPIIRSDATKYGIPLVRRTVAELKAWKPGVTSHNDLGIAFGGSDHTDPGANFPWDVFMALLQGTDGGDGDMTPEQDRKLTECHLAFWNGGGSLGRVTEDPWPGTIGNAIAQKLDAMWLIIDDIAAKVNAGGGGSGLTEAQVRAIVREELDSTKLNGP